jgi:hypothetical protein
MLLLRYWATLLLVYLLLLAHPHLVQLQWPRHAMDLLLLLLPPTHCPAPVHHCCLLGC